MITIRVKILGLNKILKKEVAVPENSTCSEVLEKVMPEKKKSFPYEPLFQVNNQRASARMILADGDVLIIIFPSAGG